MTEIVLPSTGRIGQATAVEQSRAVAQVLAAMEAAMRFPRNTALALRQMEESCAVKELAERAFYRYPRGGTTVTGASVYLARELARCWRNIDHGVAEMRRDDDHGQSEMLAYAWDLESNTRVSTVFIVPHKRDKTDRKTGKSAPEPLVDMRDIYENNANAGARRVRECIFAVLPPWYVEKAKQLCQKTIEHGGGVPLPQRIAEMLKHFEPLGISEDDIERKLGRPQPKWTATDVAQLWVIGRSLQRGEISREEEFPPARVTADEIRDQGAAAKELPPAQAKASPPPAGHASEQPAAQPQSWPETNAGEPADERPARGRRSS